MTADPAVSPKVPWVPLAWFTALVLACYAPVVVPLVRQWAWDDDMGHGFFVPVVAAYIAWQRRDELLAIAPKPNWWGLLVVFGAVCKCSSLPWAWNFSPRARRW